MSTDWKPPHFKHMEVHYKDKEPWVKITMPTNELTNPVNLDQAIKALQGLKMKMVKAGVKGFTR